jgi:peptidoglycan/LPS O-acetylase OafA/YrhL
VTAAAVGLIFSGIASPGSRIPLALSAGPLAALGRGSYSLYLWHTVPLAVIWELGRLHTTLPVFTLSSLVFVACASSLSYHLLERRFMRSRSTALVARQALGRPTA